MRKPVGRESPHMRKGGSGKAAFESRQAAEKQALRLEKVFRTGRVMVAFHCPECRKWHVGRKGSRWR